MASLRFSNAVTNPPNRQDQSWQSMVLVAVLVVLAWFVLAGFPATAIFQAVSPTVRLNWGVIAATLVGAAVLLAGLVRSTLARVGSNPLPPRLTSLLTRLPGFWFALALGLLIRILSAILIEPTPASDGATYLRLAQKLMEGEGYASGNSRAYWPPGMAFALLPFLALPIHTSTALVIFGLVFYIIAAIGTRKLAIAVGLEHPYVAIGYWLLALWPTHIACTGLPEKELVLIALVPWLLWAMLQSVRKSLAYGLIAGALMGCLVYVQPSLQLFPIAALAAAVFCGVARSRAGVAFFLGTAVMLTLISPWTLRNWTVLGAPVLVSTNGGSNLYRANNALATGAYVEIGDVDLDAMDELSSDREGKRLAVEWIIGHPAEFLQLTAGKLLLFAGDDSHGVYAAFRARPDRIPRALYLSLKTVTTAAWLVLWVILVVTAVKLQRDAVLPWRYVCLLLLPYLYLAVIHGLFESKGKYHLPALVPLFVLAAKLAAAEAKATARARL